MKKNIKNAIVLLAIILIANSCKKKDDPKPSDPQNTNEEELITTFKLILTEDGTGDYIVAEFEDLDGSGGNSPVQNELVLNSNHTYTGKIILLDKTKTPVDSISNEVKEESEAHQFFYTVTSATINVGYNMTDDSDSNGVPVGLAPILATGAASSGKLKITLKHQPGVKPTSGLGDINKGETDIEVTFNVTIN